MNTRISGQYDIKYILVVGAYMEAGLPVTSFTIEREGKFNRNHLVALTEKLWREGIISSSGENIELTEKGRAVHDKIAGAIDKYRGKV